MKTKQAKSMTFFQIIQTVLLMLLLAACGSKNGKVTVSREEWKEIQSFPKDVVFFTSASNPITSLKGLENDEVAMWGMELLPNTQKLLALSGRTDTPIGLSVIGTGNDSAKFNKNLQLRLFVTYKSFAKDILDGGGIQIEFVEEEK